MLDIPNYLDFEQVKPLSPLLQVADEFNVQIIVFGGAATRAWMYESIQSCTYDIFDLVPFNSDIDMWHSGPPELTAEIRTEIYRRVTFSPWCRWSIQDKRSRAGKENRDLSTIIPLRNLQLSTGKPSKITPQARIDLEYHRVSFKRNSNFQENKLSVIHKDLEVFGLLVALNTVADMKEILGKGELNTKDYALELSMFKAWEEIVIALDSSFLSFRLWHLLTSIVSKVDTDYIERYIRPLIPRSKIIGKEIEQKIEKKYLSIFNLMDNGNFSTSRQISPYNYRAQDITPEIITGEQSYIKSIELLKEITDDGDYKISPLFKIIGLIPNLTIQDNSKIVTTDNDSVNNSGKIGDFVQFSWVSNDYDTQDLHSNAITAHLVSKEFPLLKQQQSEGASNVGEMVKN